MEKLFLHVVIIPKTVDLDDARKMAQSVIRNKKKNFYRETEESYRFRNIPKTAFKPGSFVSKKVNENMTLVFGHLLDGDSESE
jgi:hypothetical protein